jgi:hypothetical protein
VLSSRFDRNILRSIRAIQSLAFVLSQSGRKLSVHL